MSQSMPAFEKRKTADVLIPVLGAPTGATRFEKFLNNANQLVIGLEPTKQLILCSLLFEGITSYQSLLGLLNSGHERCQMANEQHVVWESSEAELHTRALDARTVIATSRVAGSTDWQKELAGFKSSLIEHYPDSLHCLARDVWDMVFHDVTSWICLHLPKAVLGILLGEIACISLPLEVLKRANKTRIGCASTAIEDPDLGLSPAHDQAMDALVDDETEGGRARYLQEIRDLLSGSSADEIRVSNPSWRAGVEIRLASVSDMVSKGGTNADAVLLLWVHYLLTVGSLRLNNPSVSTVARYLKSIGQVISEELGSAKSSVLHMEEEEWSDLFDRFAERAVTDEQRTGLAAFLKFCVDVFGIQPQASVLFPTKDSEAQVHANHVWDHELEQCLIACDALSENQRVCLSVQFMLSMAVCFPLRIGELQGLRLEDFTVVGDVVELRYQPRSAQHQGKSRSAKRVMHSSDARWSGNVSAWLRRRTMEEADGMGAKALVLGDPHQPLQTYRFGMCSRLLNTLLKHATGDRTVSFHTLRHAWVNRAVLQAVHQVARLKTVDPLQEIAVQVGHNDVRTTLLHYFHLPASALRTSLDYVFMQKEMPSATASFWLTVSSQALRKAKQRASDKTTCYWHRLQQRVREMECGGTKVGEPSERFSEKDESIFSGSLGKVQQLIADLSKELSVEAACSRVGVEQEYVDQILQSAMAVLHTLDLHQGIAHDGDVPRQASPEVQWIWIKKKMSAHDITIDLRTEPSLKKLFAKQLSVQAPTDLQKRASQVWLICKRQTGFVLNSSLQAEGLLAWLKDGEVPADCLVLRHPATDIGSVYARAEVLVGESATSAETAVGNVFGAGYVTELVRRRHKTDGPYLLIARSPVSHKEGAVPPAMLRMNRLHGLLFSMSIWVQMSAGAKHEKV